MDTQAHRKPPETPGEHREGLRHLAVAVVIFVGVCLSPYLHDSLEEWRVWSPEEDPVPFATLLSVDEETGIRPSGGIAAPQIFNPSEEGSRSVVERELGGAIADNLGELVIAAPDAGSTEEDVDVEVGSESEASDVVDVVDSPEDAGASVVVSEAEFTGVEHAIILPEGPGIRPFFEALERTARGDSGAVTRVAHFGDSTIAADDITRTVRSNLQRRFGDAGHGFILAGKGHLPYRHKGVVWKPSGWKVSSLIHGRRADGHYGYGGVVALSWGGGKTRVATARRGEVGRNVQTFEIFHQTHPGGGSVRVQVDGGEWTEFSTQSEALGEASHVITVPDGPHELIYRAGGGGHVRLYGVALERQVPGVVWDSLGIVGARGSRLLNWDVDHLRQQFARRQPALMVLQFGGNEASDSMKEDWYREKLTTVVRHMRQASPGVPCMLLAPLDQGENHRGRIRTMPNLPWMVSTQAEVAKAEGCAFWNTWEAMGGEGAMRRWQKIGLGGSDFRHATPRGYEAIGNMFYKALLQAFHAHLGGPTAPAAPEEVSQDDGDAQEASDMPIMDADVDADADGDVDAASDAGVVEADRRDAGFSDSDPDEAPRPEEIP